MKLVYIIYKKSQYRKLNPIKKLLFIIKGKSKTDYIKAFTTNIQYANIYVDINSDVYISKSYMDNNEYDLLLRDHSDKEILCYENASGQLILIDKKYKSKLVRQGATFL